ncbi:MAG: NAD(P)/FAD-dependent oxidoreductase [Microbacteriaceae bacterium]
MSSSNRRHAEISGAGFAGLTAAVALAQRGWSVRVHERGKKLREEGAGIVLWQNSLKVLDALGVTDELMAGSMTPPFYETRMENKIVSDESFDGIVWRTMTRPLLHSVLLNAARKAGATVVADSEVISATDSGEIALADGTHLEADLIVGADGVGSNVRNSLGIAYERERSGDGISRFLVRRRKADLAKIEPDTDWDNMIDFWNFEPRVLRVLYTPANDTDLYLALMAPAADKDGSRVPIDLDLWTSIHPQLTPVLEEVARKTGKHYGYQTTRVAEWTRGQVALIGDSAHAMCPALAQGAGCAMVNAYTLAQAASEAPQDDLPDALAEWERLERPYTDRCQERSQYFAESRAMSKGNQFVGENVEAALYNALDPHRHDTARAN